MSLGLDPLKSFQRPRVPCTLLQLPMPTEPTCPDTFAEVLPPKGECRRFPPRRNRSWDPFRGVGAGRRPKIHASIEPRQKRGSARVCCLLVAGPRTPSGPSASETRGPFRSPRITEGVCNSNERFSPITLHARIREGRSHGLKFIRQPGESNLRTLITDYRRRLPLEIDRE